MYGSICGMGQGQIRLVILCIIIAVTAAALPYFAYIHFVVNVPARSGSPLAPEQRLAPALVGSVLVPIGILPFGWTSRQSINWVVPTIGVCFTVRGFAVLLQTIFIYIGLAYPQYSASLLCGNGFVKQMVAYAGVLWSHPLYVAMCISKAMSLLGALCALRFRHLYFILLRRDAQTPEQVCQLGWRTFRMPANVQQSTAEIGAFAIVGSP